MIPFGPLSPAAAAAAAASPLASPSPVPGPQTGTTPSLLTLTRRNALAPTPAPSQSRGDSLSYLRRPAVSPVQPTAPVLSPALAYSSASPTRQDTAPVTTFGFDFPKSPMQAVELASEAIYLREKNLQPVRLKVKSMLARLRGNELPKLNCPAPRPAKRTHCLDHVPMAPSPLRHGWRLEEEAGTPVLGPTAPGPHWPCRESAYLIERGLAPLALAWRHLYRHLDDGDMLQLNCPQPSSHSAQTDVNYAPKIPSPLREVHPPQPGQLAGSLAAVNVLYSRNPEIDETAAVRWLQVWANQDRQMVCEQLIEELGSPQTSFQKALTWFHLAYFSDDAACANIAFKNAHDENVAMVGTLLELHGWSKMQNRFGLVKQRLERQFARSFFFIGKKQNTMLHAFATGDNERAGTYAGQLVRACPHLLAPRLIAFMVKFDSQPREMVAHAEKYLRQARALIRWVCAHQEGGEKIKIACGALSQQDNYLLYESFLQRAQRLEMWWQMDDNARAAALQELTDEM